MKTIEDAKRFWRLCNATNVRSSSWEAVDELGKVYELCCDCCPECTTRPTLMWVWPELEGYDEVATDEEWTKYVKEQDNE